MRCVQISDLVIIFGAVGLLFGLHWYCFNILFSETKKSTGRKTRSVRYLCSKHLLANRKDKEFIVVNPTKCEICKTVGELK